MSFVTRFARFWRGVEVTSTASAAETARAVETGVEKVPLSIAAPWTGVGHPNNTLRTIAVLMKGERREY